MTNNIKIYVCYHAPAPIISNDIFQPIQVGKILSNLNITGAIGDDTGDNISQKNRNYCELTALYWIWKNTEHDFYGLMHYRRLLNFNKYCTSTKYFSDFSLLSIIRFQWLRSQIKRYCHNFDIITAPRWDVHPVGLPNLVMSNYQLYERDHNIDDLNNVLKIIKSKYPKEFLYIKKNLYSTKFSMGNIMLCRASFFKKYCEFLFDVIGEAEKKINLAEHDDYQKRIWGFIAERLLNGYVDYLVAEHGARWSELQLACGNFNKIKFEKRRALRNIYSEVVLEQKDNNPINVAFAIDDKYTIHCMVVMQSIFSNSKAACLDNYNIYILHDEKYSNFGKTKIAKFCKKFNVNLKFICVDSKNICHYPMNRSHISNATYYRLEIHNLLPENVNKIIYLDSDVVVLDDLAKFWDMLGPEETILACADEGGVEQIRRLRLPSKSIYFNAGILLLNIDKLRALNASALYENSFYQNQENITLQDQDILNLTFNKVVSIAPIRWNVQSRFYSSNKMENGISKKFLEEAVHNPAIIHFSDVLKPWHFKKKYHPLGEIYWYFRLKAGLGLEIQSNFRFWKQIRVKAKIYTWYVINLWRKANNARP